MIESVIPNGFALIRLKKYEDLSRYILTGAGNRPIFVIDSKDDFYSTRKVERQPTKMIQDGQIWAVGDECTEELVVLKNSREAIAEALKWWGRNPSNNQFTDFNKWPQKLSTSLDISSLDKKIERMQKCAHIVKDASDNFDYFSVNGIKVRSEMQYKGLRSDLIQKRSKIINFEHEFKLIEGLSYVEGVYYHQHGFDVILSENEIEFEQVTYKMPEMAIRFVMHRRMYDGHCLSPLRYTHHPHVGSGCGTVCLGEFQTPMVESFNKGMYSEAVNVLWQWKCHYNQRDPYQRIYNFPQL